MVVYGQSYITRSERMLIQIDERGLKLLEEKTQQNVKGQSRWYYVGAGDEVTAIVVAKGLTLVEGQIWDVSSGNEKGFSGFCRKAHEGKKIGKLTLHALFKPESVGEDEQIFPLSYQLHYFVEQFGDI